MAVDVADQRLRKLILGGSVAGLIAHVIFLAAFYAIGAYELLVFNVGSVLLYGFCIHLAQHGRERLAMIFVQVEVLVHAGVAVMYLGWDSGFHYYVFCLIPPLVAVPGGPAFRRLLFLAVCASLYLGFDMASGMLTPAMSLTPEVLYRFRAFNIVASLAILGYLTLLMRALFMRAEMRLTDIATTDLLSGLYTRRHGLTLINREMDRSAEAGTSLAFVLADIDDFKQVNDRHGHEVGDHLVAAIGKRMRSAIRRDDMVVRWGGDEFLLILPGQDIVSARATAERVQHSVAADPVSVDDLQLRVGMTCGVVQYSVGDTVEDCLRAADAALYEGKRRGRNQVVAAAAAAAELSPGDAVSVPAESTAGQE